VASRNGQSRFEWASRGGQCRPGKSSWIERVRQRTGVACQVGVDSRGMDCRVGSCWFGLVSRIGLNWQGVAWLVELDMC